MSVQTLESLTGEYKLDVAHTRIGFAARHAISRHGLSTSSWKPSIAATPVALARPPRSSVPASACRSRRMRGCAR